MKNLVDYFVMVFVAGSAAVSYHCGNSASTIFLLTLVFIQAVLFLGSKIEKK